VIRRSSTAPPVFVTLVTMSSCLAGWKLGPTAGTDNDAVGNASGLASS
jgi:hypothetical protein